MMTCIQLLEGPQGSQPGSQYYLIFRLRYNSLLSLSQTDYQLMVISNGTNPISLHHFSCCSQKFFHFYAFHPPSQHIVNPFLHSTIHLSHNPSLSLSPPLSVFPGNCFTALLVVVGRMPQVYGPVKGPSSTLGPKPLFSQSLTPLTLE